MPNQNKNESLTFLLTIYFFTISFDFVSHPEYTFIHVCM